MLIENSPYDGERVILTTKHGKASAVAPPFERILGAKVIECQADTDSLGTFSGEVERQGSAAECASIKCELGLDLLNAEFGISSEGSFGPHPELPFIPAGVELLCFVDRRRRFQLTLSRFCERTNYRAASVDSFESLLTFATGSHFPSHALIIRPNCWKAGEPIFKGLTSISELEESFARSREHSEDKLVWVETDMRAHLNPTRMAEIELLATELAQRLATPCPRCGVPGWGSIGGEKGLPCEFCGAPTAMIAQEIFGCPCCSHRTHEPRSDGLGRAQQLYCSWCNP